MVLKRKLCKCGCGRFPTIGFNGFNISCVPQEEVKKKIKQYSSMKKTQFKIDSELDKWFEYQMANNKRKCQNCGMPLDGLNEKEWKGSQHHILEKSIFKSVMYNKKNHLVLGYYCCHPVWHESMESAKKMKVFQDARKKVKALLHFLNQEELRRVSKFYDL